VSDNCATTPLLMAGGSARTHADVTVKTLYTVGRAAADE